MKKLSIITIMLNKKDGFARTAASVARHMPEWCEWIVVDGASTDGTLQLASDYSLEINMFLSEPDTGIANAFNKGISLSSAEYILFLNAGDTLMPSAFEIFGQLLNNPNTHPPVIVGRIDMGGRIIGRPISFGRQRMRNYLPHQAMLIRRSLFRLLGGYDESFSLGMDYEWSLRLKPMWPRILFVDDVFSVMELGGVSMTRYKETFRKYDIARMKHCNANVSSRLVSEFFILKTTLGKGARTMLGRSSEY